jgi:lipopolysaccharide biosynthesis regulator YciM
MDTLEAQGDLARQKIVLDDLLRRPGVSPEQKTVAEIMLSNNRRQAGQLDQAEQLYQSVKGNPKADANWRGSADQLQKMIEWNRKHPDRPIDLNGAGR